MLSLFALVGPHHSLSVTLRLTLLFYAVLTSSEDVGACDSWFGDKESSD